MSLKAWLAEKALQGKLPNWMYRLIGKLIKKKLEDQMTDTIGTETAPVPWYRRRTSWIAIVGAIIGCVGPISNALGHPIVIPAWVYEVLASMGLYTLRDAVETNK